MSNYTPSMRSIRDLWVYARTADGGGPPSGGDEFDRALAAHDAEVTAKALEDAARDSDGPVGGAGYDMPTHAEVGAWLRARAAAIRT